MSTVHGRVWPRTCQDVLLTPCRVPCSARAHLDGALTDASRGIPLERRRFQLPTGSALLPLLSSSRLATFVRLLHNWWFNVTFGHGAERGVEREQVRRWKNRYRRSSDVRMVTNTPGSMLRSRSAMARKRGTSQSRLNDGWGNGGIPYAGMPGREANEEGCEAISNISTLCRREWQKIQPPRTRGEWGNSSGQRKGERFGFQCKIDLRLELGVRAL